MAFEHGVKKYTRLAAVIEVYFPEDQTICRWCPFCRHEDSPERHWCRLTNEMIYNPNYGRARGCPMKERL